MGGWQPGWMGGVSSGGREAQLGEAVKLNSMLSLSVQ